MQDLSTTFLALYLAHLGTDFVFQSDRTVLHKREGGWAEYAKHGAIHCTLAVLAIGFANLGSLRTLNCFVVIFGLTIVHLLLDRGKVALASSRRLSDSVISFLLDQILHAATVVLASWLIVRTHYSNCVDSSRAFSQKKGRSFCCLSCIPGSSLAAVTSCAT
jgi:hypothetical protein